MTVFNGYYDTWGTPRDNNLVRGSEGQQLAVQNIFSYPQVCQISVGKTFRDEFCRATAQLGSDQQNVNGMPVIYKEDKSGTATNAAIAIRPGVTRTLLDITAGDTIADSTSVLADGIVLERKKDTHGENRDQISFSVLFNVADPGDSEGFIGIMLDSLETPLTVVPTTDEHMGIKWDRSALGNNFFFTSGDGTDPLITDTLQAVTTADQGITITWTGNNDAKIFLGGSSVTQTATALDNRDVGMIHFMVATEGSATKTMSIINYRVSGYGTVDFLGDNNA